MNILKLFFLIIVFDVLLIYNLNGNCKVITGNLQIKEAGISDILNEKTDTIDDALQTLKNFYNKYILEASKMPVSITTLQKIVKEYGTDNLLEQVYNHDRDYDLFFNANFFDEDWIDTILIVKDSVNTYSVFFPYEFKMEEEIKVTLEVIKEGDTYKINKIIE